MQCCKRANSKGNEVWFFHKGEKRAPPLVFSGCHGAFAPVFQSWELAGEFWELKFTVLKFCKNHPSTMWGRGIHPPAGEANSFAWKALQNSHPQTSCANGHVCYGTNLPWAVATQRKSAGGKASAETLAHGRGGGGGGGMDPAGIKKKKYSNLRVAFKKNNFHV